MTVKKSKQYEVKRIFIGSPGDVPKERKIFPDVVKRVNKLKANSMGVQLEAIGWEDTLPGKGRPRPQSNINEDLLKCDLIIMILWNRWGSATGKYSSGFEEEYELADFNRKEIWIFFREVFNEMLADPGEQLKNVIEFKDRIEKERKYFFKRYKNEKEWKEKLEEYICDWLDRIGPVPQSGTLPETPPGFQGLQDAADYKISLSKLNAEVDDFISEQVKKASKLASQAKEFANEGRISKAEEYYAKALSISSEPNIINNFGHFLFRIGEVNRAEEKFALLMDFAESTKNKAVKSIAFANKGLIHKINGELFKAEKMYNKSLEIDEELDNKVGMAAAYGNLGLIKKTQSKLNEAEKFYEKALKLYKDLGRKEGMALSYGNLGVIKKIQGELEKAEKLYYKSLELNKELGNKAGMAAAYGNLGILKKIQSDLEEAEKLHNKSLELNKELGNKEGMASVYGNLGILKKIQGEPLEAEKLYEKTLEIEKKLGNKEGMALSYGNLGVIKKIQGELEKAEKLYEKALEIFESLGNAENVDKIKKLIAKLEEEIKKNKK